jgi:hypothetical protein
MGFEFKHYAFMTVLICSVWALFVSGLTSVEELGNIQMNSELANVEEQTNHFAGAPIGDKFASILKVLNVALPLAFIGLLMLVITYKSSPIGFGSMTFGVVLFLFATTKTMDAADIINATTEFSLDARVWWWM